MRERPLNNTSHVLLKKGDYDQSVAPTTGTVKSVVVPVRWDIVYIKGESLD